MNNIATLAAVLAEDLPAINEARKAWDEAIRSYRVGLDLAYDNPRNQALINLQLAGESLYEAAWAAAAPPAVKKTAEHIPHLASRRSATWDEAARAIATYLFDTNGGWRFFEDEPDVIAATRHIVDQRVKDGADRALMESGYAAWVGGNHCT